MVEFIFERQLAHNIVHVYIPTTMLIIFAYCSLYIGLEILASRVALSITTQLALITQLSGLKAALPKVSYVNVRQINFC